MFRKYCLHIAKCQEFPSWSSKSLKYVIYREIFRQYQLLFVYFVSTFKIYAVLEKNHERFSEIMMFFILTYWRFAIIALSTILTEDSRILYSKLLCFFIITVFRTHSQRVKTTHIVFIQLGLVFFARFPALCRLYFAANN